MSEVFEFAPGELPLLVSIPHDGRSLAPGQAERMTERGQALPDTDWHVGRLYGFAAGLGANVITASYSRYVVDLNRPASDAALYEGQVATGLCPSKTFAGEDIYLHAETVDAAEQADRVARFWQPYHDKIETTLDDIRQRFGYALLWDAHSIQARVPLLFDGRLPDLNIGTNDGASCGDRLLSAVAENAEASAWSSVVNGRFRGGYITRHYGDPRNGVHAIQLELAQCAYMDEDSLDYDAGRAAPLAAVIRGMLEAFLLAAGEST